jgi:hypothetical protein
MRPGSGDKVRGSKARGQTMRLEEAHEASGAQKSTGGCQVRLMAASEVRGNP